MKYAIEWKRQDGTGSWKVSRFAPYATERDAYAAVAKAASHAYQTHFGRVVEVPDPAPTSEDLRAEYARGHMDGFDKGRMYAPRLCNRENDLEDALKAAKVLNDELHAYLRRKDPGVVLAPFDVLSKPRSEPYYFWGLC